MKKFENEFRFLDTPEFNYKYRSEVHVLGRRLIHIGEGVFMFEEPFEGDALSLDHFTEKLEDYKDISFIRFHTYQYDENDNAMWSVFFNGDMDKKKWIIPFAISTTHRRHSVETIEEHVREYMAGFDVPDPMQCIIKNIAESYIENDNASHSSEEIYYNKDVYDYRPVDDECTHLLDFEYDPDDERFVFVKGFVGRKILEGIYYFDDSVSLADSKMIGYYESDMNRLRSADLNPGDFKEDIAFIGKEIWSGGSISIYQESSIYYMAFGDSAIGVLHRLYKSLSGYEMRIMKKDAIKVKNEPVDLMAYIEECKKKESSKCSVYIPEGACELVEGMGFRDLNVRCRLLFQNTGKEDNTNSSGFSRYEVAYIMDEKLYLINYNIFREQEEGYELSLRMVKELSVRYKARLFDHVEEDIVQVVIDNGNAEKSILGEEDYSSYLKFVTGKN